MGACKVRLYLFSGCADELASGKAETRPCTKVLPTHAGSKKSRTAKLDPPPKLAPESTEQVTLTLQSLTMMSVK